MRFIWPALAAVFLALPAGASAEERISQFRSDIRIQKDATVDVTESLDVGVEHDRISHGIYRDFPTHYRTPHGGMMRVGFNFERATLDGQPVPVATSSFANGIRVKIGDPDQLVPIGAHRYVIQYRVTREIGFFKNFDELYWNVTGNGWIFPIDVAQAHIMLPEPVRFGQRASYTGPTGSSSTMARVADEQPGQITFETTEPLGANEGLTVAVSFPKGVVTQPARTSGWIADYGPVLIGILALLGLCGFYYIAWQRAGRNPRAGTVVPIFSPPDDLSAPAMRYVVKMGTDDRAFAAALVDMGVRGHLRMVEEDGGWLSRKHTRLERLDGDAELPDEENAALRKLCSTGDSIVMEQENHTEFAAAKESLDGILDDRFDGKLFKRNFGWAVAGAIAFVAALWVTAAAVVAATNSAEIWQIGVVLGALAAAAVVWGAGLDSALGKLFTGFVSLCAVALACFLGLPIIGQALGSGWLLPLVPIAIALPLVISGFWWMAAPTKEGRTVLDHIAGFRQYLSITERERLDRMTAPQDTPAIFEKYLPYAIALGVENRWANRFQGVLAAAQAEGRQGFAWYSGSSSPWTNPGGFTRTVGASLASTISAASTAPGSSSGSGGGGFSGGGGGGGGGGGW